MKVLLALNKVNFHVIVYVHVGIRFMCILLFDAFVDALLKTWFLHSKSLMGDPI